MCCARVFVRVRLLRAIQDVVGHLSGLRRSLQDTVSQEITLKQQAYCVQRLAQVKNIYFTLISTRYQTVAYEFIFRAFTLLWRPITE